MGSLPNLHELGKTGGDNETNFRPGPALGHLCGGCNGAVSTEEKSKILHRFSGHARITKARSNPQESNKIVYDDFMLEHMATYSPISTRSRYNLNMQTAALKRRDSMNSSIGATSVRRLIAVVRGGCHGNSIGRPGATAVYSRRVLMGNLVVVCICHLMSTAAFLPFLALQSSVSIWAQSINFIPLDIDTGSLLVAGMYFVAALLALLAPCVVKRYGASFVIAVSYGVMLAFYASHLYPVLYIIVPASLLMGIALGLQSSASISFLMTLSHRITGLFQDDDEDNRQARRTCVVRRVARAFQGAHDFGLIVGSVLSAVLITYTINLRTGYLENGFENTTMVNDNCLNNSSDNLEQCKNSSQMVVVSTTNYYDYNSFLDDIFDRSEDGRLCGVQACPIPTSSNNNNTSIEAGFRILPNKSAEVLIGVFAGACALAGLLAALGLDRIRMLIYQDPLERGVGCAALRAVKESFRDRKLQMAAPLTVFIGIEQAFMYADFSKSYVVCTLGIHRLNLVFLSMGLLQSIAACTLSMLLRTIRRYYVVAVGFLFHGCLLMVLIVWKPIEDDPALFYVISASWGVCNAIWEMLSFTLLTGLYADNWEAAFANTAFFKFIGLSIAFVFHGLLCNYWKLYAMAFLMPLAVIPFTWLEIRLENIRKVKNISRL